MLVRDREATQRDLTSAQGQRDAHAERIRNLEGQLAEREQGGQPVLRGNVARLEEEQASLSKAQQKLLEEKRKAVGQCGGIARLDKEAADAIADHVARDEVRLARGDDQDISSFTVRFEVLCARMNNGDSRVGAFAFLEHDVRDGLADNIYTPDNKYLSA